MKTAIIVHGFKGKPNTNWKPWLKAELEMHGFSVDIPEMPNTEHPRVAEWVQKVSEIIQEQESNDIYLIGHSLGCITILKYLEQNNVSARIKACIFVAGFTRPFDGYHNGHDDFFEKELDWQSIKEHCQQFIAIHSNDDTSVPVKELFIFESKLDAKIVQLDGFGHFGSSDDVFEIPVVRDIILDITV